MKILIKDATIINEGQRIEADLLIENDRIKKIGGSLEEPNAEVIDASGLWLIPGVIDDQVHFREPGLTHKANIATESRAAAAGGITSYMEMPNTNPQTTVQKEWENKMAIADRDSMVNYGFFFGATNDNIEEVLKVDPKRTPGIKIFMGSSTGNMLVDAEETLENIFSKVRMLIATHCEDEATIRRNMELAREKFGEDVPMVQHPLIRSAEACYLSSSKAVELAKKHDTRLHILHISTERETHLFDDPRPLGEKRITAEACVHHLYFTDQDYPKKGSFIKWNPAVKTESDREGVWKALLENRIDIVATDHAPHTLEEKQQSYFKAPSGGPLVQHALPAMLEMASRGKISPERVVEKMCHAPAQCFHLEERGYIREGYKADLVLVDPEAHEAVRREDVYYKCGWSPFEGEKFSAKVLTTFVNGVKVYDRGSFGKRGSGEGLRFNPPL